jgi:hypothetical protein
MEENKKVDRICLRRVSHSQTNNGLSAILLIDKSFKYLLKLSLNKFKEYFSNSIINCHPIKTI